MQATLMWIKREHVPACLKVCLIFMVGWQGAVDMVYHHPCEATGQWFSKALPHPVAHSEVWHITCRQIKAEQVWERQGWVQSLTHGPRSAPPLNLRKFWGELLSASILLFKKFILFLTTQLRFDPFFYSSVRLSQFHFQIPEIECVPKPHPLWIE